MNKLYAAFSILMFSLTAVNAAEMSIPADPATRYTQHDEHFVVSKDGKTTATYAVKAQILKQGAVDGMKQYNISISRTAQSLKVLDAYTLKSSGKKIAVPKSSWQVRTNTGNGDKSPIFSDTTDTTLLFPDLAVGDSIFISYRVDTKEPLFPGKVSLSNSYGTSVAYDNVNVTVEYPHSMKVKFLASGMSERTSHKGNSDVVTWKYANPSPLENTRRDWSVYKFGDDPGYLFSSFDSWEDVAKSYVARATPKAKVTPEIQSISDKVVGSASTNEEKAKLVYDWVTQEIEYAGNCVGIGAVVPRDLEVVLRHRMGDCKDHATLLQAMLSAQGIESHQVLVNASNIYELPDVPVASFVNHVINWIPEFSLFADSTSAETAFGRLPQQDEEKPILGALESIPKKTLRDRGDHFQTMNTKLSIEANGDVTGQMNVETTGRFSEATRHRLREITEENSPKVVRQIFRSASLDGEGVIEPGETHKLNKEHAFQVKFKVKSALRLPGSGAIAIGPWFYSEGPISNFAMQGVLPAAEHDVACSGAMSIENYEIKIPSSMEILSLPEGKEFKSSILDYSSTYSVKDHVIQVRRVLNDKTSGSICNAETNKQYRDSLQVVIDDVRQQLLYR